MKFNMKTQKNLLIKNYQLVYAFNGNYMLQYEYRWLSSIARSC